MPIYAFLTAYIGSEKRLYTYFSLPIYLIILYNKTVKSVPEIMTP